MFRWLLPFVGHMGKWGLNPLYTFSLGIATSKGVIRDFAGSYYVSEDDMAFGWPTNIMQLTPNKVEGGAVAFDHGEISSNRLNTSTSFSSYRCPWSLRGIQVTFPQPLLWQLSFSHRIGAESNEVWRKNWLEYDQVVFSHVLHRKATGVLVGSVLNLILF